MVADGVGLVLDEVKSEMTIAEAPGELQTASGTLRPGSVAGQHWTWSGMVDGQPRIVHETVWRMHGSVAPEWPQGKHSVVIEGAPGMHLEFDPDWIADGLLGTAMHAVNAIEPVCAAPPGIATLLDLAALRGRMAR